MHIYTFRALGLEETLVHLIDDNVDTVGHTWVLLCDRDLYFGICAIITIMFAMSTTDLVVFTIQTGLVAITTVVIISISVTGVILAT